MPNLSEALSRLSRVFGKSADPAEIDDKLLSRFEKLNIGDRRGNHMPRLFRG
jgi:hypothetical protein